MISFSESARSLLDRARVGHLATASRSGRPHVIPFCYVLEGDLVYFVVDEKPKARDRTLKRIRNITENPEVALVVDVYDEDWRRLEYVLVSGRAEIVGGEDEFRPILDALRTKYRQYADMRLEFGRNTLVRITPTAIHHWRASS